MNKNKTEQRKLYEWACRNSTEERKQSIFTSINDGQDTYYEEVANQEYIREYGPETAEDIRLELSKLWGNDETFGEVLTICTVACMKNKNAPVEGENAKKKSEKKELKPYIYQF